MPPISIAGQTIGIPPRFINRNTIEYFEDFVAGNAAGNAAEYAAGAMWSNDSNANWPALVGVLKSDWNLGSGAFSIIAQPRVPINVFATVDWQCSFRFNGFDLSGGRNQAFGIGMGNDTDGCQSADFLGFRAGSSYVGTCGTSIGGDNILVACAEGSIFDGTTFFGSVALAGLLNRFVTLRMVYTRSVPQVDFYADGNLLGSCTTPSKIPTVAIGMFNPGVSRTISNPNAFMYFDWFRFVGTLNR